MKDFKIRCSAIAEIMAGNVGLTEIQESKLSELSSRNAGQGKPLTENMKSELALLIEKKSNPELPEGAKTYIKKWLKKKLFNRNEDWKSNVIEKGLMVEPISINMLSRALGVDLDKNDEFFSNEFIQGSPDIVMPGIIRDIKSSWDIFTFPMFDKEIPKKEYWWQLQGYMILTGARKASLDYILVDTPMPLVMLDLRKLYFQSGGKSDEWNPEAYESMYPNYRFDDVPESLRIKSFEFDFDASVEEKINQRVMMCRKFIESMDIKAIELLMAD